MTRERRPDIDGLRALAVIPVVLFHSGVAAFSGGYVGVDVFFVISGYLITGVLADAADRGAFSLLTFYDNRAAFVREPGRPGSLCLGGSGTSPAALADLMAKAESYNVTVTRFSAWEMAPPLVDDLDDAKVNASTLLLLGARPTTANAHREREAEFIGEVDTNGIIRMAIERLDYAHELWSRPGWCWPAVEKEAA
jgi:hypothetical protein